jgi:hypothetical protein
VLNASTLGAALSDSSSCRERDASLRDRDARLACSTIRRP